VASYQHATAQVSAGWINANALTIIDLTSMEIRYSVLLDDPDKGAANPWGVGWSADEAGLVVAHAGTHEVSVINSRELLEHLPEKPGARPTGDGIRRASRVLAYVSAEEPMLPFLGGSVRERVGLGANDLGPRAVWVAGQTAYVANYFSDTLSIIDLSAYPVQQPARGSCCGD
jgi:DNA-binding beta-propeller fold protein YncE